MRMPVRRIGCCVSALILAGSAVAGEKFTLPDRLTVGCPQAEFSSAASRLAGLLGRIYGCESRTGTVGCIRFVRDPALGDQAYRIVTDGTGVRLFASSARGASYAAADLLHEIGYRVFVPNPNWEILPIDPQRTLSVTRTASPSYLRRILNSPAPHGEFPDMRNDPFVELWAFANRMGGKDIYSAHVYQRFVREEKDFFREHPECLALVKGERTGDKLCISNPLLRKRFVDWFVARAVPRKDLDGFSAEPSDCGGWCACAACAKQGSPSDRCVLLANEAARALAPLRPDMLVSIAAYNCHCTPTSLSVEPNVLLTVTDGFFREGWDMTSLLSAWRPKVRHLGAYPYWYSRVEPGTGDLSDWRLIARSLRSYHDQGVRYLKAECKDVWANGMLGANVAAALMWDIGTDERLVVDDFFAHAFPHCGEEMRRFFALLDGGNPRPLTTDLLARMYRALDGAWAKASSRGGERARVEELVRYAFVCEKLLAYRIGKDPDSFRGFLEAVAVIRRTRLVFAREIQWRAKRFDMDAKLAEEFDWMKPRPEVDARKILSQGLATYRELAFEPVSFAGELREEKTGVVAPSGFAEERSQARSFYLWSDGRPFPLKAAGGLIEWFRDRGPVKLSLVQIGGVSESGEMETVVWKDWTTVVPDGAERTLEVVPKRKGLHRLDVDDGGDRSRFRFPEGMAVAIPLAYETDRGHGGRFYIRIPDEARKFGFFTAGGCDLFDGTGKRVGKYERPGGYFLVDAPLSSGRVWSVKIRGYGSFTPLTAPRYLNLNADRMIVPAGKGRKK